MVDSSIWLRTTDDRTGTFLCHKEIAFASTDEVLAFVEAENKAASGFSDRLGAYQDNTHGHDHGQG